MLQLEQLTRAVCQIAREAGAYIRSERLRFSSERIERKHAHDYVSYVDKGSEQLIVSALRQLLPEAGFVTEEGTTKMSDASPLASHLSPLASHLSPLTSDLTWVIDPLDGTTNFIHQYAPYAVSIALLQGTTVLLGVVYEVCADECYYAWQGGGAYVELRVNSEEFSPCERPEVERRVEPLHVSTSAIDDALLCLQLPYNSEAYKPVVRHLIDTFYGRAASIRMIGSAAMALCYVAAGRLDGYAEQYLGRWDYMAGSRIVLEAGGIVSDYSGSADYTRGNSVVAANSHVHRELLEAIIPKNKTSK
jgi:myo-inositol-1(or 4)-monophosphatase